MKISSSKIRFLALALALSMIFATMPVFAISGTEAIGISSFDQITDPNGNYYLTRDISVTATSAIEQFTGKLDGREHTITTSVALFRSVKDAEFIDLKLDGSITNPKDIYKVTDTAAYGFYAALAITAAGKCLFENITSDVDFTVSKVLPGTDANGEIIAVRTRCGGLVAYAFEGYDLTFTNCVNNGDIDANSYEGGIFGWTDQNGNAVFNGCINNGSISTGTGYVAGITSRTGGSSSGLVIKNCQNNGEITSMDTFAGGILGYANCAVLIQNTVNNGKVTSLTDAGGIAASIANSVKMINCINTADVSGGASVGGMLGLCNMSSNCAGEWLMEGCINSGKISSSGGNAGGMLANSSSNPIVSIVYKLNYCVNTGNISGKNRVGGLIGYAYAKANDTYVNANACINTGYITNSTSVTASQLVAYLRCY